MFAVQDCGVSVRCHSNFIIFAQNHWPLQDVDPKQTVTKIFLQFCRALRVNITPPAGLPKRNVLDFHANVVLDDFGSDHFHHFRLFSLRRSSRHGKTKPAGKAEAQNRSCFGPNSTGLHLRRGLEPPHSQARWPWRKRGPSKRRTGNTNGGGPQKETH